MWSLRPTFDSKFEKYIVISFIEETRILGIEGEEIEEVENIELDQKHQTICCETVLGDKWVQVTEKSVRLVDSKNLKLVDEWKPPTGSRIHLASVNPTQIVLSLGSGMLMYMEIKDNKIVEVRFVQTYDFFTHII